ncbi:uncharacterized protein with PIN domain [Sphingomonas insulae]|uniref:PIN domain-containing protein n=1 Tax=Sphingomonas insulae TaxID=424800 RepID=A0ABN1HXP7_9SPHN|nr:type II toxin-antitoxin system VapC family toxin [Sphingomonas insulae]NIJ29849.1 uncharacterized protein with PIN domain [Sphingomonas insulae]
MTAQEARLALDGFVQTAGLRMVPIGRTKRRRAVDAHARSGKGYHPARLNLGDCFAYACARTHHARLLYQGDDFSQTDLA